MTRLGPSPVADLFRALGVMCEAPGVGHARLATALGLPRAPTAEEHTEAFVLGAVPHASVYLGPEGMLGGEARDRVAGFWRALGRRPSAEPDHLASLLGLYADLLDAERSAADPARGALTRQARAALLWEHLASWLPTYLGLLAERGAPPVAAWARLLLQAVLVEIAVLGPPGAMPAHLRAAPGLPGAGTDRAELIDAVLAPVRVGMLLTRGDLARGASELGLALRAGERRFALLAMADQDAAGTFGWLAEEADRWHGSHEAMPPELGGIAAFWRDRAAAAGTRFREEAAAKEVMAGVAGSRLG